MIVYNYWYYMIKAWKLEVCNIYLIVIITGHAAVEFPFFKGFESGIPVKARLFRIVAIEVSFLKVLFIIFVLIS